MTGMHQEHEDFEGRMARLGEIVARLERGDSSLEEGVALFKEGLRLAAACRKELDAAKHDVLVFQEGLLREFEGLTEEGADDGEG